MSNGILIVRDYRGSIHYATGQADPIELNVMRLRNIVAQNVFGFSIGNFPMTVKRKTQLGNNGGFDFFSGKGLYGIALELPNRDTHGLSHVGPAP